MRALSLARRPIRMLDPMVGSGTSVVSARMLGHEGVGIDRDPLAVLIARASSRDLDAPVFEREAQRLLTNSRKIYRDITYANAYPENADNESRAFVRFWFDLTSRRQLAAMTRELKSPSYQTRAFLKIAISRMIVTKQGGVSLAEDVSHSRPHRTRDLAPRLPFDLFAQSVQTIIRNATFVGRTGLPSARIIKADCRRLPFDSCEFDCVVTSPPYLNAIDYLRGHRLSLVWFGHQLSELREIRGTNIGGDRGSSLTDMDDVIDNMVGGADTLDAKMQGVLRLFVHDLRATLNEAKRVLRNDGTALLVVGDCTIRGVEIRNSHAVHAIAKTLGFKRRARWRRSLPENRRYLPPPSKRNARRNLQRRMWDEVVLEYSHG